MAKYLAEMLIGLLFALSIVIACFATATSATGFIYQGF